MRTFGRRFLLSAFTILALGALGLWLWLKSGLPVESGEVLVPGLRAEATIVRDTDGVPHIFAADERDLFFAQGYAHAQDRLWQLEMNRRVAQGRLSELFGETSLETDRFLRTLGLYRAAQASLGALSDDGRAALEAYAAGVNAYLAEGRRLPPEFILLGFVPEPWEPVHSLGWVKMMSWDLAGDYSLELLRSRVEGVVGRPRAAALLPAFHPGALTVLPDGSWGGGVRALAPSPYRGALDERSPAGADIDRLLGLGRRLDQGFGWHQPGSGSNSWAVSGRLTGGGALLANDPHLSAQIPGLWYLVELHGGDVHVAGASLPGVPGVVIGRNRRVAWGFTNLDADVQDLYLEAIDPQDPRRVLEPGGGSALIGGVDEPIRVKGRDEPVSWRARSTARGPLISDAADMDAPVSLRWTALDPDDTTLDAFLALSKAADWPEVLDAMRAYVTPTQDLIYADVDGNIGLTAVGRVPIRAAGGRGDRPAAPTARWTGHIPFDELPRAFNPRAGFIVAANNRLVGDGYPHHLSNDWSPDFRARRIQQLLTEALDAGDPIDLALMRRIQLDRVSLQAADLAPLLAALPAVTDRQRRALALLDGWDGAMGEASAAAALYQVWYQALVKAMLADELKGDVLDDVASQGQTWLVGHLPYGPGGSADPDPDPVWCDDLVSSPVESCADIALSALDRAIDHLEEAQGSDPAAWRWGELHHTQYGHRPFSEVPYLRPFFHRAPPGGGDTHTVNVANVSWSEPFEQRNLPSYRQLVDLGAPEQSLFMGTTGQSGHVLSRHYDDLLDRQRAGEYLLFRLDDTLPTGEVLRLVPGE